MKTIVQSLRDKKGFTQTELAERSGLSLRTIQRIEAGSVPQGFTLRALAEALETDPVTLIPTAEKVGLDRAKLINLSALLGLVVPFGSVIFPLILTYRTKDARNKEMGKRIASVQILLVVLLSISLILSPFIQKGFAFHFPLFMVSLIVFICLKLLVVVLNGISLNTKNDLPTFLKINYL